jgi:predicted glutamine amidotransferase
MCRLFGLHADKRVVTATFWLLDEADNLVEQSRHNPDGTGLGVFGADGEPVVHKQPIAAWQDQAFATEAHSLTGTTFIAHVRYSSSAALEVRNTHPLLQDGRIFAHNGVVEALDVIDDRLAELGVSDLVHGQTDSERIFALITGCARREGDVGVGLVEAVGWLAETVPIFAVNILLSTARDMWALRYPETHELYLLDRRDVDDGRVRMRSHRITAHADELSASVLFASEPMDDDDWHDWGSAYGA